MTDMPKKEIVLGVTSVRVSGGGSATATIPKRVKERWGIDGETDIVWKEIGGELTIELQEAEEG